MKAADLQVTRFKGLNTVEDPLTLGLDWLTEANNILITGAGKVERRMGHAASATVAGTAISSAYATRDQERAYLIDAGTLKTADGVTLSTALSTAMSTSLNVFEWRGSLLGVPSHSESDIIE